MVQGEAGKLISYSSDGLARNIYNYVAGYLTWPTGSRINVPPSAVTALQSGIGGCAEFANLTTALSRAAGIPAVTISGLAMPELLPFTKKSATWSHPVGAHAWVELYTDTGWIMADPSWAGRYRQPAYYGRNDGKHLSFGPDIQEQEVYSRILDLAKQHGTLVAAMSAPNKFIATASPQDAQVTPKVTITKGLDSRHIASAASLIHGSFLAWIVLTSIAKQ
ncbi:MAG: transglutaminase domain-containing protein [Peptococcaceae bacterium]|nr:transglutaminase domain-containing protein [Peptococcaceae bacterium]